MIPESAIEPRKRRGAPFRRIALLAFAGGLSIFLIAGAGFAADATKDKTPAGHMDLSLQSVMLFALNNNPEIKIAKEHETQAGYATQEALSILYPQLEVTVKAGEEYNAPANFTDADAIVGKSNVNPSAEVILSANQLLYDGSTSREEVRRRETLEQSSQLQTHLVRERIMITTIESYMLVYRLQNTLAEYDAFLGRLDAIIHKVKLMVDAGAESKAKLKYANSRLAFAQADYNNTRASLTDALTDLEFLTGKLPAFKAVAPEVVDLVQIQLGAYKDLAEKNNTNFLINATDRKALEHELEGVKGRYLPTVNMIVEMSQSHDSGGEVGRDRSAIALLQLSYKIFDGYARDASKGRVTSQLSEIDFRRQRAERDIMQKIKLAYNQITALEAEHHALLQEIEANTELQALYKEQFELGEGDVIAMIEGEERLFTSRTRLYKIDTDIINNSYALLRQIGYLDQQGFCENC